MNNTPPVTGDVHEQTLDGKSAVALTATLVLGVLSYQLNASMLSPALPDIAATLHESISAVSQVSSTFFLAGAVLGMIFTRWSDYLGRRRTLLIVLGVLTVGTVLCLLAQNLPMLLIGRVLQGASNATFNFAYLVLASRLRPRLFGTALGVVSAINGGVAGVDGYLGGLFADHLGFRAIFVVVLVFSALAAVATWRIIPRDSAAVPGGRMDWWGALLLAVALVCLSQTASEASAAGWLAASTLAWLAGFVVSAVVFWAVERRCAYALVPIRHLASRYLWPVLGTTVLALASVFTVMTYTVVLLGQEDGAGFGLSASTAALLFLTPPALLGALSAPIAGTVAGRVGWLPTLRIGMIASLVLMVVIAFAHDLKWVTVVSVALLGITFTGVVLTSLNGLSVVQTPPDAPAVLPGLNGASFGIGAGIGIAVAAPFVGAATEHGFRLALWLAVVVAALAFALTFVIRPRPITS